MPHTRGRWTDDQATIKAPTSATMIQPARNPGAAARCASIKLATVIASLHVDGMLAGTIPMPIEQAARALVDMLLAGAALAPAGAARR